MAVPSYHLDSTAIAARRRGPVGAEMVSDCVAHVRVWAPACESVSVVLSRPGERPLEREAGGYFAGQIDARPGDTYRFRLDGSEMLYPDPASRFGNEPSDDRLLIVNLGADLDRNSLAEPLVAPPAACGWSLEWSSEDTAYGGSGTRNIWPDGKWSLPSETAVVCAQAPAVTTARQFEGERRNGRTQRVTHARGTLRWMPQSSLTVARFLGAFVIPVRASDMISLAICVSRLSDTSSSASV